MVKWLDKLVERLRREKTITLPPAEPVPEQPWMVYGYEPIGREGVYRFCYDLDATGLLPRWSTSHYVALVDAAVDGSLGIELKHHPLSGYCRTDNSRLFTKPLSFLTPHNVFDAFWRNLERQPCFPDFPDYARKVFPDGVVPVLYHQGGLELLTDAPVPERLH